MTSTDLPEAKYARAGDVSIAYQVMRERADAVTLEELYFISEVANDDQWLAPLRRAA